MIPEEQQIEYDIYYQGSPEQLLSLVYPLGPPSGGIFDHLELQKANYKPLQKSLEMRYLPTASLQNTQKPQKQVVYGSKHIPNRSNYFFSTFLPDDGCFVWRSVNCFLQMRPTREQTKKQETDKSKAKQTSKIDKEIEEMMLKRDGGRLLEARMKSYKYVQEMHESEPKIELTVIPNDDAANYIVRRIEDAPTSTLKPTWKCSRQEYIRSLSQ